MTEFQTIAYRQPAFTMKDATRVRNVKLIEHDGMISTFHLSVVRETIPIGRFPAWVMAITTLGRSGPVPPDKWEQVRIKSVSDQATKLMEGIGVEKHNVASRDSILFMIFRPLTGEEAMGLPRIIT